MKLFSMTEMIDASITVKILKDNGEWIALRGDPCNDMCPAYGIKFRDGEEDRLKEWINREQPKKITM